MRVNYDSGLKGFLNEAGGAYSPDTWDYPSQVYAILFEKFINDKVEIATSMVKARVVDVETGAYVEWSIPRSLLLAPDSSNGEFWLVSSYKEAKDSIIDLVYSARVWRLVVTINGIDYTAEITNDLATDSDLLQFEGLAHPVEGFMSRAWGSSRIEPTQGSNAPKLLRPFYKIIVEDALEDSKLVLAHGPSNFFLKFTAASRSIWRPTNFGFKYGDKSYEVSDEFEAMHVYQVSSNERFRVDSNSFAIEIEDLPALTNAMRSVFVLKIVDASNGAVLGYLSTMKQNVTLLDNKVLSATSMRDAMRLLFALEEISYSDELNSFMAASDKVHLKELLKRFSMAKRVEDGFGYVEVTVPADTKTNICSLDIPSSIGEIICSSASRSVNDAFVSFANWNIIKDKVYVPLNLQTDSGLTKQNLPLYETYGHGQSCYGLAQTTLAAFVSAFVNTAKKNGTFTFHSWLLALEDSLWSMDNGDTWPSFMRSRQDPAYYHFYWGDEIEASDPQLTLEQGKYYLRVTATHCTVVRCDYWNSREDYAVSTVYDSLKLEGTNPITVKDSDKFRSFKAAVNAVKNDSSLALEYGTKPVVLEAKEDGFISISDKASGETKAYNSVELSNS